MNERCPCCGQCINRSPFGSTVEEGPFMGLPARIVRALTRECYTTREQVRELVERFAGKDEEFPWTVMVRNLGPKAVPIVERWLQDAPGTGN